MCSIKNCVFINSIIIILLIIINNNNSNVINANRVKRIVGGIMAAQPPPDDPVVFVKLYNRDARVEGMRTGLYSFLGIRYADPPIGENRFMRPRYRRLAGDLNARMYPMPCPQPHPQNPNIIVGNEDCLILNVFTPRMPDETIGLPVIVWIHGGGFRTGSANQYGPDPLTRKGVIIVSIQYRLGTLGIIGDGSTEFSGNLALFDMMTAIRWVNEYISFFGGDPKQIKVMGQGSGATSAMYLSTSKLSRSSINGVVAMSGTPFTKYSLDEDPKLSVNEISNINKCPTVNETEILKCLRMKDVKDIIQQDTNVQVERLQGEGMLRAMTGMATFEPVQEQPPDSRALPGFIDESPQEIIKKGTFNRVPLLTGVIKDETGNGINLDSIKSVWSSANEFLKSLTKILELEKILGDLLNVNQILPGIDRIVPLTEYLQVADNLNPGLIVTKLVEATTDALFNLPAVVTADVWSKFAPSFLYSFEHKGSKSSGSNFLSGLPLVSNTEKNDNIIGHGDELGYLFDACDIFGKPLEDAQLTNASDLKVRDQFTGLIAKFAHFNVDNVPKKDGLFSVFTTDSGSPYIKIGDELTLEKNFRVCELSIWGLSFKTINAITCESIVSGLTSLLPIKELPIKLTGTGAILAGSGGGGLLGSAPLRVTNNKKKGNGGLLGGLF